MSQEAQNTPKTLTVAEAGERYFGLCRASSYAAVQRGEIPVIRIGRLLRVPVIALEEMLKHPQKKDTAA
jgi:excisionase family DNA binding protein